MLLALWPGSIRVVGTVREAVTSAQIVVTVATSDRPLVEGDWLASGCHVNAICAHYPERRELDTAAIVGSTIFVDSAITPAAEKGELLVPVSEGVFSLDDMRAELGEVVCGHSDWRRCPEDRTVSRPVDLQSRRSDPPWALSRPPAGKDCRTSSFPDRHQSRRLWSQVEAGASPR